MKGKVYIVHCVDTEGPLFEDENVPFQMIKSIFGIEMIPTKENLRKLQNGEIDLNGKEDAVKNIVDPHRIVTRGTWEQIKDMLKIVTGKTFREKILDSKGGIWKYNWFCMDHVGFTGENPRKRDAGYHKIFDFYQEMVNQQNFGDFVGFHYHPVSFSGNYHDSGTAYWGSGNLNQILCHKIIDRQWFPVVFRPGFHTERPDSNWFLEQWIPFDYSNQRVEYEGDGQVDLSNGRFGDWRRAPLMWHPYHPSHDDYQMVGDSRRWITRCLNMYARTRQITFSDVAYAFKEAEKGKNTILAFTDHDYKDMEFEITRVREMIWKAACQYPGVDYIYSDALEAMRECLGLIPEEISLSANIEDFAGHKRLKVDIDGKNFGPQPFLAIKARSGEYFWDNFDFLKKDVSWSYTFDHNTIPFSMVEKVGVACSNSYGKCEVVVIDTDGNKTKKKLYTS